ncbi:MAG: hypothetical protein JNM63_14600, partial [Spirochaetia bacterium]|nr:hypothetical protein [Spirochaetia bacterium]
IGWIVVKWSIGIFFGAWLIRHGLAYLMFIPGLIILSVLIIKRVRRRNEPQKALP